MLLFLSVLFGIASSSAASCISGQLRSVVGACNKFEKCSLDGKSWEENHCLPSQSFDPAIGKCRYAWDVDCMDSPSPCNAEGAKFPVPGNCNSYYECIGGKFQINSCGFFMNFDQKTATCRFRFRVDCSNSPDCSGDVKIPVERHCKRYKRCINGIYKVFNCDENTSLDINKNECLKGISPDCLGVKQYTTFTDYSLGCSEMTIEGIPGDCYHFKECHGGFFRKVKCPRIGPFILKFDCDKKICVYKHATCCPIPQPNPTTKEPITTSTTQTTKKPITTTTTQPTEKPITTPTTQPTKKPTSKSTLDPSSTTQLTTKPTGLSTTTNSTPSAKCKDGDKKGVKEDCSAYDVCEKDKWVRNSCTTGKHFDCVSKDCAWFEYTCCKDLNCMDGDKRGVKENCTAYDVCEKEKWMLNSCTRGKHFDCISNECTQSDYTCCKDLNCMDGDKKGIKEDCSAYYVCEKDKWERNSCTTGKNFDCVSKECSWLEYTCCKELNLV